MDAQDKLLAELNALNDPVREFSRRNIGFINPVGAGAEISVTVVAVPGRGYSGTTDINYKRYDLAEIDQTVIRTPELLTPELLVELLGNKVGAPLAVEDLQVIEIYQPTEGDPQYIDLAAKQGSLWVVGSGQVVVELGKYWLEQVVWRRRLSELQHPTSRLLQRASGRMLTWGKDFTSVRDAIRPDAYRQFSDWPRLQACAAAYQIPSWEPDIVVDRSTAEVPDANPAFDRVVVQANVASNYLSGPLYFHYNLLEEI